MTRVCHVGTREGEGLVLRGRVSYLSLIVRFFFLLSSLSLTFFSSGTSLSLRGGRGRSLLGRQGATRDKSEPGCEWVSLREGGRDPGKERAGV